MKQELETLNKKWKWKEDGLKYINIEAPAFIVSKLIATGVHKPELRLGVVQQRMGELRDKGILKQGQQARYLFDDDGGNTVALAGQVSMEVPLRWQARRGLFTPEQEDGRSGGTVGEYSGGVEYKAGADWPGAGCFPQPAPAL